ncbi:Enamine deaminase RidA, house cleaning of reactive enamine intermediates, YjgF/YER057c/UK114 family [Microlunatus soli]|uniref:Enamine deaminase RidA, house cleaning of reactive enamine intermediates, YjgF/YER057c/UK114 family n=2 Tax=Microlunatus soli TaxID=630515 RepID=A0A1H1VG45_9ACTN|nr:Enamine deaminase RidA, house cleaning of reactive enamine intermediates, YjgF/YER057c/UK114 family [Microlunatus soli]
MTRGSTLSDVAEYAYSSKIDFSDAELIFTAGACPLAPNGTTVAVGDVAGQAAQVMANLEQALADAGAALTDVMQTTVYVASADRRDLVAAWTVVRDGFGDHAPPSTLLGVAALGYPDQLVEVTATAVRTSAGQPRHAS